MCSAAMGVLFVWIPCGIPNVNTTRWHTWHQEGCCKLIVMLNFVSARIIHLILETNSTCIRINDCILQDFKSPVDVSTEDLKRVREMLCEYILKETIDWKGNFYSGTPWVYCSQKLETHSVFFSQVLLPEKPLACLVGVTYYLVQAVFSWLHPNKPWWE
jgi:hypothetical protein